MITAIMSSPSLSSFVLLGQTDPGQPGYFASIYALVVTLCIFGLPVLLVTFLIFRYLSLSRNQLHRERLAAIEAGFDPREESEGQASERFMNQAFWIAFWLVVCGSGASFVSVSGCIQAETDVRVATIGWIAAGISSMVSTIAAGVLIIKAKPR